MLDFLLHMHEDLSSNPHNPCEKQSTVGHNCVPLLCPSAEEAETGKFLELEFTCLKNKVDSDEEDS